MFSIASASSSLRWSPTPADPDPFLCAVAAEGLVSALVAFGVHFSALVAGACWWIATTTVFAFFFG